MELLEAIDQRHSVRSYTDQKIPSDIVIALKDEIGNCNQEGNLRIQLVTDNPDGFAGFLAHYGKFVNVKNYIALVGTKSDDLDTRCGYYGERLVLKAKTLGLDSCWVALTFSKSGVKKAISIEKDEKLVCVIALGYGLDHGFAHKSKPMLQVIKSDQEKPDWFLRGVEAALKAPTAMNQQKFCFELKGEKVTPFALKGYYSNIDLGIVTYHFEIGSGRKIFNN